MSDISGDARTTTGVDDDDIRRVLRESEVWAIVGLGGDPGRPAYGVAAFLQSRGKRIVPVHPSAATVHGERGYASLADIPFAVDVADVFRRSADAGAVADEALARDDITTVWFQLGWSTPPRPGGCTTPDGPW